MSGVRLIEVKENILDDNDRVAETLRQRLKSEKTFLLNLMAGPGAGKTSLVIATATRLKGDFKIAVLEADIDSTVDAEKVLDAGIEAIQMKTGGFCHLDATMVEDGLMALGGDPDLVILENVGNLVCPAEFDTGATLNAMILSIPEGHDKPLKYPLMFSVCDVVLVNKIDTKSVFDFEMAAFRESLLRVNPEAAVFEISCKTGEGISAWTDWLKAKIAG